MSTNIFRCEVETLNELEALEKENSAKIFYGSNNELPKKNEPPIMMNIEHYYDEAVTTLPQVNISVDYKSAQAPMKLVCNGLRSLTIMKASPDVIDYIAKSCPDIISLRMKIFGKISTEQVVKLFKACKKLEHIILDSRDPHDLDIGEVCRAVRLDLVKFAFPNANLVVGNMYRNMYQQAIEKKAEKCSEAAGALPEATTEMDTDTAYHNIFLPRTNKSQSVSISYLNCTQDAAYLLGQWLKSATGLSINEAWTCGTLLPETRFQTDILANCFPSVRSWTIHGGTIELRNNTDEPVFQEAEEINLIGVKLSAKEIFQGIAKNKKIKKLSITDSTLPISDLEVFPTKSDFSDTELQQITLGIKLTGITNMDQLFENIDINIVDLEGEVLNSSTNKECCGSKSSDLLVIEIIVKEDVEHDIPNKSSSRLHQ